MDSEWPTQPDSAMARMDEEDYLLRKAARDLARCEPIKQAPAPSSAITRRQLDRTLEAIGEHVGKIIKRLEDRIAELEAREWLGPWEHGKAYSKGAIVNHDGSAWLATRAYPDRKPGAPDSGWRLVVKRGRDGRDAK